MNSFKKLAGETAIYGVSSIVGRFLNWWLVPYYSHIFLTEEYGVVANLYAYMAFLLVVLTYGMETGYFRFASQKSDKDKVYSSTLISLVFTSASFILLVLTFDTTFASWMDYENYPQYIRWIGIIVAIDAITSIPFAKLRIESRPIKFAVFKLINIFTNIIFNIFFLSICPAILKANPDSFIQHVYSPEIGVGYVFISNLIASSLTLLIMIPDMWVKIQFDKRLLKEILYYSFPILLVGIAGMINQNIDKILIPKLLNEDQDPMSQVGIYSANYKLAVLMNMFIQAFRYAFEPFFFSQAKEKNNKNGYALVLKYFVIFGLIIFLAISLFVDLFKTLNILEEKYYSGLKIVPIVLMANLFLGIYYTLSLWYKLTDKTRFGAYFALAGAAISLVVNIAFIPQFGYMASAIAVLICFFVMTLLSYFFGQKYYPVEYPVKRILLYFLLSLILYFIAVIINLETSLLMYFVHALLLAVFLITIFVLEKREFLRFLR
ncbi:lipopolysaccharide biosynthesis protein [Sunxiuqinia sp. A32]|uniref:lipopolysaccharide biosynthesis protein n=1 Tax=Sunxiuqinia sp. A32 TaxID=3461496 RepID=UPI004045E296